MSRFWVSAFIQDNSLLFLLNQLRGKPQYCFYSFALALIVYLFQRWDLRFVCAFYYISRSYWFAKHASVSYRTWRTENAGPSRLVGMITDSTTRHTEGLWLPLHCIIHCRMSQLLDNSHKATIYSYYIGFIKGVIPGRFAHTSSLHLRLGDLFKLF